MIIKKKFKKQMTTKAIKAQQVKPHPKYGLTVEQSLYNNDRDAKHRLKNCITLDNGSTLSLFLNPKLVQDIRTSNKTLSLATNAVVKESNREANVPGFGKVYYDEDAIANIFGFSDLKKNRN
jgi:ribosomal protein L16 Arg81 hydroxylase